MFYFLKKYFVNLSTSNILQSILVDFEITINSAITDVWPSIEINGCRFHLGQIWWRKIQELGLSAKYTDQSFEIRHFLKRVFGLPFLISVELVEVENVFVFDLISCDVSNNSKVLNLQLI